MKQKLESKALEVNLAKTKYVEYNIPDEHLWFLSLSENYWGIHKRTNEFFKELHHPYSNRKYVIELFSSVAIGDFWVYKEKNIQEKSISIIFSLFDKLLGEQHKDDLSKHLVYIFIEFFTKNYDNILNQKIFTNYFLNILNKHYDDKYFSYISNIEYFVKGFRAVFNNENEIEGDAKNFIKNLINKNIEFWQITTNIEKWYEDNIHIMSENYINVINAIGKNYFNIYSDKINKADSWEVIQESYFSFTEIIDVFRKTISEFNKPAEQFAYIFHFLQLRATVFHRNYLLLDLNNAIKKISNETDDEQFKKAVDELFNLFNIFKESHISYILDSILTLGKEIISTNNNILIDYFEDKTIEFGFVTPGVAYMTDNWELKVNPNHIKNIRVWLELIECEPYIMSKLLSALVINLRIGGIFIFDTDLFQKDITKLLNSKILPVYKQIKQLSRIFPIYFNEIGAEGLLREVTTKIDELSKRQDKLIHFLRKQIHTEGNNSHIDITFEIIHFWYDNNKERLKNIVPANVYETIDTESEYVTGVNVVINNICKINKIKISELLASNKEQLAEFFKKFKHKNTVDIKRVQLIIELYQLLKEKYLFEATDIALILRRYTYIDENDIKQLEFFLKTNNDIEALKLIFSFMVKLNEIILNSETTEGWENIYYKRHIAFGVPSMYGQYKELKFDALGLTFRLERIASVLVSKILSSINTNYFTAKTLKQICDVIQLLREGLRLDGINDQGFDSKLQMLHYSLISQCFTINQYINIFQFMEGSIKEIINHYFFRPYDKLLNYIIPQHINNFNKQSADNRKKLIIQKSEIFYRELLSSAFLIQYLDNFIGKILNNLRNLINKLSDAEIQSIMTYDSDLMLSPLYKETPAIDNQVFLGSKAYYLKKLYLNNFPVPPGFVITTEVFRRVNSILKIASLSYEIDKLIKQNISELEKLSGFEYGNPKKPLLLSVRSGSAISMPGAMNTFLNVGLNDEITELLSKQHNFGWTSWDCYRRLLQTWGMSYGIERNDFDQIMIDYKRKYNVKQKIGFKPEVMREIAYAYKNLLKSNNIYFEPDPFLQIKTAIISVFNSWNTPRAKVYREHLQIAEEWGTAVIVQQMVFGNLHNESGSGVLFTHDVQDSKSIVNLTGDFSFLSQGEDIVAGLINTLPVSENQRLKYYRNSPFSLETAFPLIYNKLNEIAHKLINEHGFGHQEIEFTFETLQPEDLYILQTRDMAIVKQNTIETFACSEKKMKRLGSGIGIGNKVLNGAIVFDKDDLIQLKNKYKEQNAILVRPDTVPDDIEIIFECEGLLTARGGSTSHAAVTASTLGKIGVVNCYDMKVYEKEKKVVINGVTLKSFSLIAIDGNKGIVYKGNYPVKVQEF